MFLCHNWNIEKLKYLDDLKKLLIHINNFNWNSVLVRVD